MSVSEGRPAPSPPQTTPASLRWWQWVLMYPALLIAILGAIPKFSEMTTAVVQGLSPFVSQRQQEQLEAWKRNSSCALAVDNIKPKSRTDYEIALLPCPSGDILVTLTDPRNPANKIQTWIITGDLFSRTAGLLLHPALAQIIRVQQNRPYPVRVLGIRTQGTVVTKRVQLSDNTCEDETIDGLTGRQLSAKNAPCSPL